jgi:NAD(P)H-flavin reductase
VLLPDGRRRAFSIANAPHEGDTIELHVRHVAGGGFTSYVFDEMQNGALLRVEGPLGTFVPREDSERPLLMVAGGTGFAPIKALIEHFRHLGSRRPMTLYWGARTARDLYLRALPERWARDDASFRFVSVLSDAERAGALRQGFVHEADDDRRRPPRVRRRRLARGPPLLRLVRLRARRARRDPEEPRRHPRHVSDFRERAFAELHASARDLFNYD